MSKSNFKKYFSKYKWSNVFAMLKNNRLDPKNCENDFKGKLVVISGATSGIGYLVAKKFASKGANLLCLNRNKEKSDALVEEIEKQYSVSCKCLLADFSNLSQVNLLADKLVELEQPIDVLIHNAGVHLTTKEITPDGIEKVFMVHYLSSFIINYKLMNKLKSQEKSRIIIVNSEGHRFAAWGLCLDDINWDKRSYSGLKSYGAAKLSQLLSMLIFDEQFKNSGVTINSMHPGAVKSETGQDNGPIYKWYKRNILDKVLKTADISAEAIYYLAVSNELNNVSAKFFNLTTQEEPAPPALDLDAAKELWSVSLKLAKI